MRRLLLLIPILIALAPFACVMESGSGDESGSSLNATVLFPPNISATDADTLIVRGTGSGPIDSLEVGGFDAESSDGFATWTAEVPLSGPQHTFIVVAFQEGFGPSFNLDSFSITRDPLVGARLHQIDMNPGWTTIYSYAKNPDIHAAESEAWAVLAMEPLTGRTLVVSGWGVGSGPLLTSNIQVITASSGDADLYLIDIATDSVIHLNVVNGARTILSSPSTGGGTNLDTPRSAVLVEDHEKLYVLDSGLDAVIAVDTITGGRSVVSSDSFGNGPTLDGARDVAYDSIRDKLLVSSPPANGILSISLGTGSRSLVSGPGVGSGPSISSARDLEFDENLDQILTYVPSGARLLAVDPATGTRTEYQSFAWADPTDITYNPITQRAWIHTSEGLVLSYDIVTGNTSILNSAAFPGDGILVPTPGPMAYDSRRDNVLFYGKDVSGDGLRGLSFESGTEFTLEAYYPPTEPSPAAMAFDDRRDHLLLMLPGTLGLYGLDPDDGELVYVSGPGSSTDPPAGTGNSFDDPHAISTGPGLRYAAVADEGSANGIILVDLLTSDRDLTSSAMTGFGPIWTEPCSIAASPDDVGLWVCDPDARIYSIDTGTGGRTLLGDYSAVGGVTSFSHLAFDAQAQTLYALDDTTGAILQIHPQTGLATIIHGPGSTVSGLHLVPSNWTMDVERGTLILACESPAALLVFDPHTQQSVLIAR